MISGRVLVLVLILAYGCQPPELALIPNFLDIQQINFTSSPGQGSGRQLITEVWIYADSQLLGAYPVPTRLPLLGEGNIGLDFFAGIRENGQASAPTVYPLMTSWNTVLPASSGQTMVISPVFTYAQNVQFSLVEDFESSNVFRQDLDGDSLTFFTTGLTNAIEGKSARAILTASHPHLEVASNFTYRDLPDNGSPVFLELEYSSDTPLAVGLRSGAGNALYKLVLFTNAPQSQKIYVNFTPEVQASVSNEFQIIFRSIFDQTSSLVDQEVVIDNIKLLHFRS